MFTHTDGTVIKIPGLPTMYDYEAFPQVCECVWEPDPTDSLRSMEDTLRRTRIDIA
jgi:hypothetical protein